SKLCSPAILSTRANLAGVTRGSASSPRWLRLLKFANRIGLSRSQATSGCGDPDDLVFILSLETAYVRSGGRHVISLEQLTVRYGAFVAVDHLDLEVRRGELFGLLGPNGAGKSSTLRVL